MKNLKFKINQSIVGYTRETKPQQQKTEEKSGA
jgi:hypothetical protein